MVVAQNKSPAKCDLHNSGFALHWLALGKAFGDIGLLKYVLDEDDRIPRFLGVVCQRDSILFPRKHGVELEKTVHEATQYFGDALIASQGLNGFAGMNRSRVDPLHVPFDEQVVNPQQNKCVGRKPARAAVVDTNFLAPQFHKVAADAHFMTLLKVCTNEKRSLFPLVHAKADVEVPPKQRHSVVVGGVPAYVDRAVVLRDFTANVQHSFWRPTNEQIVTAACTMDISNNGGKVGKKCVERYR